MRQTRWKAPRVLKHALSTMLGRSSGTFNSYTAGHEALRYGSMRWQTMLLCLSQVRSMSEAPLYRLIKTRAIHHCSHDERERVHGTGGVVVVLYWW